MHKYILVVQPVMRLLGYQYQMHKEFAINKNILRKDNLLNTT